MSVNERPEQRVPPLTEITGSGLTDTANGAVLAVFAVTLQVVTRMK
jgi:hypothetical protein